MVWEYIENGDNVFVLDREKKTIESEGYRGGNGIEIQILDDEIRITSEYDGGYMGACFNVPIEIFLELIRCKK